MPTAPSHRHADPCEPNGVNPKCMEAQGILLARLVRAGMSVLSLWLDVVYKGYIKVYTEI